MATTYRDLVAKHGSYRRAAKATGIPRTTFFDRWKKESATTSFSQKLDRVKTAEVGKNKVKRYIFTCAVRGAPVHADFLANLEAYAVEIGAELIIGPLTNSNRQRYADVDEEEFDDAVRLYISDDPLVIGDRVRYSPECNLTATCVKPLQGLQTFTKRMWGVFPHTKICLESIPTHKDRPTKLNVTTGAVTHGHYSPTKAGFRAKFDHVYGAVVVEVTDKGAWMRHISPSNDSDGTFFDLGYKVERRKVGGYGGVEAIVYGDIHVEKLDPACSLATWRYQPSPVEQPVPKQFVSLVELLQPRTHVFHDLLDMTAINYHDIRNMFKRYERYCTAEEDNLVYMIHKARWFLEHVYQTGERESEMVVVDSNHDHFLDKWLLDFNPEVTGDLTNAIEFYKLKAAVLETIRDRGELGRLELALRLFTGDTDIYDEVRFLEADESYELFGIELGWHGHRGSNGSRGSRGSFKFVTEKSVTAHIHSAWIDSGSYIVGTASNLDLGYNEGPSSWSHTHAIIYPNGMRSLVTMSDNKFWSDQA